MLGKLLTKKLSNLGDAVGSLVAILVPEQLPNEGRFYVEKHVLDGHPVMHFNFIASGTPEAIAGRSVWLVQRSAQEQLELYFLTFGELWAILTHEERNRNDVPKMPLPRIIEAFGTTHNLSFTAAEVYQAAEKIRDYLIYNVDVVEGVTGHGSNQSRDAEHF